MNTTESVNAILNNEHLSAIAASKILHDIEALPPEAVQVVNLDIPTTVSIVLGAKPKLLSLRIPIGLALPGFDISHVDNLEDLALALYDAHFQVLAAGTTPNELRGLYDEGATLRDFFRADTTVLRKRELLDAALIDACTWLAGYKNLASDLGILVTVLRAQGPEILDKCATTSTELDRAEKISMALLRYVGLREQAPTTVAAKIDLRARAFTLLTRSYDQVRRAVTYLRWDEDDADTVAPSLYAGKRRKSGSASVDAVSSPADEAPAAAGTTTAPSTPPGSPAADPFLH